MYRFVAIDLDGTLLNSYGAISPEDKEAIQKAIQKNCEIVLTSGRVTDSVYTIAKELRSRSLFDIW